MFSNCLKKNTIKTEMIEDGQQNLARTKYLIVIRHGERLDDQHDRDPNVLSPEDYFDTTLTQLGKENSQKTGYQLMNLLNTLDIMKGKPNKIRFMSSVFYRCLQTTDCLRDGMKQYIEEHQTEFDNPEAVRKAVLQRKTHVEEACSEKLKMLPVKYTNNIRIHVNAKKVLDEFPQIKPVYRSLYDYDKDHKHLSVNRVFERNQHIYEVVSHFYEDVIKRLKHDSTHDVYVVIAHGMYIELFLWHLGRKKTDKLDYNSTVAVKFDFSQKQKTSENVPPHKVLINTTPLHKMNLKKK